MAWPSTQETFDNILQGEDFGCVELAREIRELQREILNLASELGLGSVKNFV
jgi:hypothetical protein